MRGANPPPPQRPAAARLVRDVGVNVVANLIAAAIIYLAGTAAGALPRSPRLITTAMLVVGVALLLARRALRQRLQQPAFWVGSALVGLAIILAGFLPSGENVWGQISGVLFGLGIALLFIGQGMRGDAQQYAFGTSGILCGLAFVAAGFMPAPVSLWGRIAIVVVLSSGFLVDGADLIIKTRRQAAGGQLQAQGSSD